MWNCLTSLLFSVRLCCCWVTSVVSDSVRPHRQQPTRFPHPWDSPGNNTGVGCHFLLQGMKVKSENEVAQSRPTLSDPMDCSLPGSSVHGIFQARVLEWGAIAFSVSDSSHLHFSTHAQTLSTHHKNNSGLSQEVHGISAESDSYLSSFQTFPLSWFPDYLLLALLHSGLWPPRAEAPARDALPCFSCALWNQPLA